MSYVSQIASRLERFSDFLNPILVKETRQALKSRQFVATFMLLLLAAWVVTITVLTINADQIEFGRLGSTFFGWYFWILAIAIFIVVPYGSYRSLMAERDENTYELLVITSLSPTKIVWGKLFSGLVQLFIYYSVIAPFIAFTSLLEGFDLFLVIFSLTWGMFISLALCTFMMVLSLNARQRQWQTLSSVFAFGLLAFAFMLISSSMSGFMFFAPAFDTAEFWCWNIFAMVYLLSYVALFQQITAAQLTFEAGNKSTRIRLISSLQFVLVWGGAIVISLFFKSVTIDDDIVIGLSIAQYIHWAVFSLFTPTETDYLSRRIRRDLPRSALFRFLLWPFLPGGTRGLVYCMLHLSLLAAAGSMLYDSFASSSKAVSMYTIVSCYYIIYANIATMLMRAGNSFSGDFRPAHARIILVLLIAISMFVPMIPRIFSTYGWINDFVWYDIISPAMTISHASGPYGESESLALTLTVGAILTIVLNGRAIMKSLREVIFVDRSSAPRMPESLTSEPRQRTLPEGSALSAIIGNTDTPNDDLEIVEE